VAPGGSLRHFAARPRIISPYDQKRDLTDCSSRIKDIASLEAGIIFSRWLRTPRVPCVCASGSTIDGRVGCLLPSVPRSGLPLRAPRLDETAQAEDVTQRPSPALPASCTPGIRWRTCAAVGFPRGAHLAVHRIKGDQFPGPLGFSCEDLRYSCRTLCPARTETPPARALPRSSARTPEAPPVLTPVLHRARAPPVPRDRRTSSESATTTVAEILYACMRNWRRNE